MFLNRIFALSLRHKLPLWGSLLIVCTAVAVSGAHLFRASDDLRRTMLDQSTAFGKTLALPVAAALARGDAGAAHALIEKPLRQQGTPSDFPIERILVLTAAADVFTAASREDDPRLSMRANPDFDLQGLGKRIAATKLADRIAYVQGGKILLALPLLVDGVLRGHLVLIHRLHPDLPGLLGLARSTLGTTMLVLLVMLPINWYWGRRMAVPLIDLARHMSGIGHRVPEALPPGIYTYEDEVGQLFQAYGRMCAELQEKDNMRQEIIQSERLAALGRLSASVAHEINNPLAGLITAVDTLKQHGAHDQVTHRVLPLLERGLEQIREIVGALLVESRANIHSLTIRDIEDVQTLLAMEVEKQGAQWEWRVGLLGEVPLPATLVRQIMINLLLNAVQAAGAGGHVMIDIRLKPGHLSIDVANDGREIPTELKCRLFEPFTGTREGGHGLGLWVTYQIVQQLKGRIKVLGRDGRTCFVVLLPLGDRP